MLIVQIAVYSANIHVMTVIEDTTLRVLLHLHADPNFRSERMNMPRVWNIRYGFRMLWVHKSVIYYRLLMLQLDATSSHTCFGIGKGVALRKLSSDANFTITAKVFSNDASLDDIILAGPMLSVWKSFQRGIGCIALYTFHRKSD